jgi:hypothetical protein
MILTVKDPVPVFRQAVAAGATEIAPVDEDHGWRIGRLADPWSPVGGPLPDARGLSFRQATTSRYGRAAARSRRPVATRAAARTKAATASEWDVCGQATASVLGLRPATGR